jgi:hypothetical protein
LEPGSNGIKFLKRISYTNIKTHVDDDSAFFYEAGLIIDADGSPHAYHPDGRSGLDNLGNAGRPGNWWALVSSSMAALRLFPASAAPAEGVSRVADQHPVLTEAKEDRGSNHICRRQAWPVIHRRLRPRSGHWSLDVFLRPQSGLTE